MARREKFEFQPIGYLRTAFVEKFGVPRQSMMLSEARGILKLDGDPKLTIATHRLHEFSHLWIVFVFHKSIGLQWRPYIDPPTLEQLPEVGTLASRSPHRPNPIGLSTVKIEKVDYAAPGGVEIEVSGVDILDGTPVLDIKPYLPYADRLEDASAGWTEREIQRYPVQFSAQPPVELKPLIEQMLALDPRPASQRRLHPMQDRSSEGRRFAFRLQDIDVHWEIRGGAPHVVEIRDL